MAITEDMYMVRLEGFNDAVIGTGHAVGQPESLIYDESKMIEIILETYEPELSYSEAMEELWDIKQSFYGHANPIFMNPLDDDGKEILLGFDDELEGEVECSQSKDS